MERAAYTKAQLEAYDHWKIAAMSERSAIKDALKEGREEGIKMTAVNLLNAGVSIEIVCNATHLSKQQVENLKASL